jgi:hypothetical protein
MHGQHGLQDGSDPSLCDELDKFICYNAHLVGLLHLPVLHESHAHDRLPASVGDALLTVKPKPAFIQTSVGVPFLFLVINPLLENPFGHITR